MDNFDEFNLRIWASIISKTFPDVSEEQLNEIEEVI